MSKDQKVLVDVAMRVEHTHGRAVALSALPDQQATGSFVLLLPELVPLWAPKIGDILDVQIASRRGQETE